MLNQNWSHPIFSSLAVFGNGLCSLEKNWLQHIKLDWSAIHYLSTYPDVQSLLGRYSDLFKPGLGMMVLSEYDETIR